MSSTNRVFTVGGLLVLFSVAALGQGLGSSNKLFGGAKKSTGKPKATVKNASPKPKTASSKSKPVAKKNTVAKKTPVSKATKTKRPASPAPAVSKSKTTAAKPQPKKIEITPSRPKEPPVVTTPATDELFEDLIEEGNAARDARNYAAAEDAYKRAKPVKPKDSRAVYGLGNLYSDQQRWEEAESAYRKALASEPGFAITHVALSYVLTQPIAAPNLSDRYEEAEKLARRAIQLAPSSPLAFDQMGVALELRGLIGPETENAYRTAIRLDSSFAPAHAHLGRLLRRRGLARESEASYQTAIERSDDIATMVLVADVMQSEQRFAESEKLLRRALDDDPRNPSALILLGRALTALGQFGEAERVLKNSLTVSTGSFTANSLLGALYIRQGRLELAENALLQALRFVSNYEKRQLSQQFETVGDGYMKAARRFNAERVYRQAIDLDADRESLAGKLSRARFG